MNITENLLLTKWESLDTEKKSQVLAFMDNLNKDNQANNDRLINYQPKTERGKKLWVLRQEIVKKSDVKLLDWDDIDVEINKIRGKQ